MNTDIIREFVEAYAMRIETVQNHLAISVNFADNNSGSLNTLIVAELTEALYQAQQLASRIKRLGGLVPDAAGLATPHSTLWISKGNGNLASVIRRLIEGSNRAIAQYHKIASHSSDDHASQELAINLKAAEEQFQCKLLECLQECELTSVDTKTSGDDNAFGGASEE